MSIAKAASNWLGDSRRANERARRARRGGALVAAAAVARTELLERRTLFTTNPVIVYDFNEGSGETVADSSPEGGFNNGTLAGDYAPWFGPEFDGSPAGGTFLHFDGDGYQNGLGGRVEAEELLSTTLGGSASFAYYARTSQAGYFSAWQSPGVTGAEETGGQNDVFWGNLDYAGGMRVAAGDNPGASTGPVFGDGAWHHVLHTRDADSGEVRTYVDGVLASRASGDVGVKGANFRAIGATTQLTADLTTVTGYAHFNGDLDHVEVYDRVLSAREAAQQYGPDADAPPAAPASLTADVSAVNAVRLNWDGSEGALGYVVRRAEGADGAFAEVATLSASTDESGAPAGGTYTDIGLTAGETYRYEVVAFNGHEGESAAASVSAVPQATGHGVNAHYFASPFWGRQTRPSALIEQWFAEGNPDQSTKVGSPVRFEWGGNGPTPPFTGDVSGTHYSTIFSGRIDVRQEDDYAFVINTDDDGMLYVDGSLAAAAPGPHAGYDTQPWAFFHLTPGEHEFVLFQAQGIGEAAANLKWVTANDYYNNGLPAQPIPVENLVPEGDAPSAPTDLQAVPDGLMVQLNFMDTATNEWRYVLERAEGPAGPFEPVRTTPIVQNFGGPGQGTLRDFVPDAGTYRYRVRAENAEGESAWAEYVVDVTGGGMDQAGAQAYYYNGQFWGSGSRPADNEPIVTGSPDLVEVVSEVNYQWDFRGPQAPGDGTIAGDNFSTVYTGRIRTVEAGTYTFVASSDEHGYLYVNGTLVSGDPGPHYMRDPRFAREPNVRVVPIELEADTEYNFVALQSEEFGEAGLVVQWIRPGATYIEPIPYDRFTGTRPNAAGGSETGAPLAPQGMTVTEANTGAGYLTVTWDDVATNELRYVLQRSDTPDFANFVSVEVPINAAAYADTTVAPGTHYYYRLRAVNFNGASAYVTTDATTLEAERAPAAPTQLRGTGRAAGVRLAFVDASSNEDHFAVERAPASDPGAFAAVAEVAGSALGRSGATMFYTDASAAAGESYVYRVVAVNDVGRADSSAVAVEAGPRGGTGVTAEYFNATDFSGEPVVLSPVDADEYFSFWWPPFRYTPDDAIEQDNFSGIFRGELLAEYSEPYTFHIAAEDGLVLRVVDPETGAVLLEGPRNGLDTQHYMDPNETFSDTVGTVALTAGKRYLIEWRFVQRYDNAGYRVGWSSPSTPREVLPNELLFPLDATSAPLLPVHGVKAAAVGAEEVYVRWVDDNNFGETGFAVQRKPASGPGDFATVGIAPRDAQSFVDDSGVELGKTYVYRVLAVRGAELGPDGLTAAVTPAVGGDGMTLNGTATILPGPDGSVDDAADNGLQITNDVRYYWQVGSAFTSNARDFVAEVPSLFGADPVNGFTASFDFAYPSGYSDSGEGFAFVIQRVGNDALGAWNMSAGYGGLPRSFAVGFHPAYGTTYAYVNGTIAPYNQGNLPFWPGFGYGSRVELEYDATAKTLRQRVTQLDESGEPNGLVLNWTYTDAFGPTGPDAAGPVSPLDLAALMGGEFGFIGFTASSSQLMQTVRNFRFGGELVPFATTAPPQPNAAPSADAGGPYEIVEGASLALDASASSDPDGDELTYAWDLNGDDDFTDAAGSNPTLTWSQLQALGLDDGPGSFTARVRVSDGNDHDDVATAPLAVENAAPTATFYRSSGEGDLLEGTAAVFAFDGVSDPSAADAAAGFRFTYAADFNENGVIDDHEEVENDGPYALLFPEDGEFLVRGRVYDKDGGYSETFSTVTVRNMAPTIESVSGPEGALRVGTLAEIAATFHDDGHADTHTAVWDWGDRTTPTPGVVTRGEDGFSTVGGSHAYAAAGLYTVKLTVTDDEGAAVETFYRYVVVYDPALQVAAAGYVNTPTGRGTFSLTAAYRRDATTPTGQFRFTAAGVDFRSTGLDWLVVGGGRAYLRGTGTVNGRAGYAFQVTMLDAPKSGGPDRVRVKIWAIADRAVVYDNQPDALDDADPTSLLAGGGVEIRTA